MLLNRPVTLVTRTPAGTDVHGNTVYADTETVSAGWNLQPSASTETVGGQDRVVTTVAAFGPAGVDLSGLDAVRIDGDMFEVQGDPERWPSATGHLDHVKLTLRKVTG